MKRGDTSVLLKVYVKMRMKAVVYQYVIMMMSVIHMSHVIVLTVMTKRTIVLSMELVNNSSVPKIRLLRVLLINSHTVAQHVSMVIPVMRVDSVLLLQFQLD